MAVRGRIQTDMEIPAGATRERVVADFGPEPAEKWSLHPRLEEVSPLPWYCKSTAAPGTFHPRCEPAAHRLGPTVVLGFEFEFQDHPLDLLA